MLQTRDKKKQQQKAVDATVIDEALLVYHPATISVKQSRTTSTKKKYCNVNPSI